MNIDYLFIFFTSVASLNDNIREKWMAGSFEAETNRMATGANTQEEAEGNV
jgi:hypothetical protein